MYIKLEKKSRTKTPNNSYNIAFSYKNKKVTIGSYNQSNNKLTIDLWNFIMAHSKGTNLSRKLEKIIYKTTAGLINKGSLKIKF